MVRASVLLVSSLILAFNAFAARGPASVSCERLVGGKIGGKEVEPDSDPGLERKLNPAYKEKYIDNNTNKVVEVSNQAPIENQENRGFCHMYSLYVEWVREYKARNGGRDPQISIYFWTYYHWLPRAIETAQDMKAELSIPEGSWYENTYDVIKRVGVVTQEQWANFGGKTDIQMSKKDFIELGQLKTLVQKSHLQLELLTTFLKPNLLGGSGKDRMTRSKYFNALFTDPVVMSQFTQFVVQKQKEFTQKRTTLTQQQITQLKELSKGQLLDMEISKREIAEIFSAIKRDIADVITREFNMMYFAREKSPLPTDLTPFRQQALQMFPEMLQTTVSFVATNEKHGKARFKKFENDHAFFEALRSDMMKLIKDQIDRGNSVWLGYDHNSYFVDGKTGAMTIEGMSTKPINPQLSRKVRDLKDMYYGGHAVQIVGYEIDSQGQIVAFKIQNSWGQDVGNKGYFRMDMSYFMAYAWRISLRDEAGHLTKDVIKKLREESEKDDDETSEESRRVVEGFMKKPV